MKEREIETLMLAGGIGKRLESITGCNQPKCFVELNTNTQLLTIYLNNSKKSV